MVFPWKPPFSYGFPGRVVSSHEKTWQLEIPYWFNNGISHIFDGGLYWWMGSNVNITYNGYLMLILILLVITSEYCYVWFAKGSLKIGDALPVDALMWLKQCHKPSPSHHHFYRWYGYHSQMGGLWHCFTHSTTHSDPPLLRVSLAVGIAAYPVYELVAMGPLGRPTLTSENPTGPRNDKQNTTVFRSLTLIRFGFSPCLKLQNQFLVLQGRKQGNSHRLCHAPPL